MVYSIKLPQFLSKAEASQCMHLQNGLYCPKSQPAYSAYREASFGHGILEFLSPTEATWSWHRCAQL